MNDMNVCGNHEALIGYLYDECAPAERDSIAAHVALCASCAEEVQALRDTRAHLGAWTPPALPLGFQITRTESETPDKPAKVLRPAAWRQPLPAWAQVAAAVVIFAAGMSVNGVRSSGEVPPAVAPAPAPQPVAVTNPVDDLAVTRDQFARLEARLRSMENSDVRRTSLMPRNAGAIDGDELSARMNALEQRVGEGDSRMLRLISTVAALAREADAQRAATQRVNLMEEDVQDLRSVVRTAIAPSLAVRTSLTGGR